MLHVRPLHLAIAGCLAGLAAAAPARAQVSTGGSAASSEAFGLSAAFTSGGMSTSVGPADDVAGSAPPAYSKTKLLAAFDRSVAVPPLVPAVGPEPTVATFTAKGLGLKSHVASGGIGIDFVSAVGSSDVASASLTIIGSGPPGTTTPDLLYLGVTATGVATSATYSQTFPAAPKVSGTTSFKSLSIGGSLLGGKTVTYSGDAPANTVLFSSPTVTITAHQQIIVGLISCGPGCTFTPNRIIVQGLDINLDKAMINGFPVTGDIVLGDAAAQ